MEVVPPLRWPGLACAIVKGENPELNTPLLGRRVLENVTTMVLELDFVSKMALFLLFPPQIDDFKYTYHKHEKSGLLACRYWEFEFARRRADEIDFGGRGPWCPPTPSRLHNQVTSTARVFCFLLGNVDPDSQSRVPPDDPGRCEHSLCQPQQNNPRMQKAVATRTSKKGKLVENEANEPCPSPFAGSRRHL